MSYRSHLTSLAAALLALAVGLVVGSTSLSDTPAGAAAVSRVSAPARSTSVEAFAQSVETRLIKDVLPQQRVLLVLAPDAPATAGGAVRQALAIAGASVTEELQLRPSLLSASGSATVNDVVSAAAPGSLTLPSGSVARATAALSAALVASHVGTTLGTLDQQKVLGGFTGADLLTTVPDVPAARATLVVLLAGPGNGGSLATLATQFQARAGTVVLGTASAATGSGVVAALRRSSAGTSDVDGLGTAQSLVGLIWALSEQCTGASGHYGVGPGATAVLPQLR